MPRLHRAFALIGLLLLTQSAAAEKLRLVADAWPPFTDATLVNGGLATDIVSTALARAGYASDFEQVPWARALLGVGEGRYDVSGQRLVQRGAHQARPVFRRVPAQPRALSQAQRRAHRIQQSAATAHLPDCRGARLCLFAGVRCKTCRCRKFRCTTSPWRCAWSRRTGSS